MFGIGISMIRLLCDNPWEGGGGYTPQQVAEFTPDQAWFRLCDRDLLRKRPGEGRVRKLSAEQVTMRMGASGKIRGRAADGTPLELPLSAGESVAGRLLRESKERKEQEAKKRKRKRK